MGGLQDPEDQKSAVRLYALEIMGNFIHRTSTIWLPKPDPNKDNTDKHATVEGRLSWGPPYTNNYRQLRDAETRMSLPQEGAPYLVIQH